MGSKSIKKGFNRNHLIIMALGNIIGSGIFLGSGTVISTTGPAAILAYIFGGIIMVMEVMFITEMTIINPAPGSFRVHASEIFGPWIGFVNGWMFWFSGVLGMASEVAAAAIFTGLWFPGIPLWVFCVFYALIMTVINLKDARGLSIVESFLASVKVISLIVFIVFGFTTIVGITSFSGIKPLPVFHSVNSFMPNGFRGIFASMIMVMFSLTGTGIIGIAIAESENPEKDAPPAIYTITITVIVLYTLSILFIICLMPWKAFSTSESPFVEILNRAGVPFGSDILNFVVLTAALSGLNSSMYSASRMLNSLSLGKQAPKKFLIKNKNGVPVYALGLSSVVLLLTAIISYIVPSKVFEILATASGFTALVNWLTISITHYFYRRKTLKENPDRLKYKVPGWPLINFIAVTFIVIVFATSPLYPGQISGLIGSITLFVFLVIIYVILKTKKLIN